MLRRMLLPMLPAGLLFMGTARAQNPQPVSDASIARIRQAVIRATRYPAASIDVAANTLRIVITITNSEVNSAPHRARMDVADRITSGVSHGLADIAELATVQTIQIRYMARQRPNGRAYTVDRIDFRKTPEGWFEHHLT